VGLLLTGIFVGPHGLRLIKAVNNVETLAEIGVVLLLFTIGLEFSFKELSRLKKAALLGGSLQVVLTVVATFAIVLKLGEVPSLKQQWKSLCGF
jgi:CPA2 family monovalent cation:H+ antiporter-2